MSNNIENTIRIKGVTKRGENTYALQFRTALTDTESQFVTQ